MIRTRSEGDYYSELTKYAEFEKCGKSRMFDSLEKKHIQNFTNCYAKICENTSNNFEKAASIYDKRLGNIAII